MTDVTRGHTISVPVFINSGYNELGNGDQDWFYFKSSLPVRQKPSELKEVLFEKKSIIVCSFAELKWIVPFLFLNSKLRIIHFIGKTEWGGLMTSPVVDLKTSKQ